MTVLTEPLEPTEIKPAARAAAPVSASAADVSLASTLTLPPAITVAEVMSATVSVLMVSVAWTLLEASAKSGAAAMAAATAKETIVAFSVASTLTSPSDVTLPPDMRALTALVMSFSDDETAAAPAAP